ncbi:WD40-repeat-containing domain protein [Glomus cerebriforme]|uniref:WD40-repeat-containing domain protein n=1 Tax=Glomus cerebriforme TaxID=658196 RepID=A0A397T638_9GLOM|nr:WD40-repeat-containing domain protein [Glomus cerebriforme]
MTLQEKPEIFTLLKKKLSFGTYAVRWIPSSAKLVVLGQHPKGTAGLFQVYELNEQELTLIKERETGGALKCGTFGASSLNARHLATGDFDGRLALWDLEHTEAPVISIKAHSSIINDIDGCGGSITSSYGPPELATASRDGTVKIWDIRQKNKPVVKIDSIEGARGPRDTWCVAFGNAWNNEERVVAAGYDSGEVKLFDLKAMSTLSEFKTTSGAVSLEFDRQYTKLNRLTIGSLKTLEVFEIGNQDKPKPLTMKEQNDTIWCVRHVPQAPDLFMVSTSSGTVNLFQIKSKSLKLMANATVTEQPVASVDWHINKSGLSVFASFDGTIGVNIVTNI